MKAVFFITRSILIINCSVSFNRLVELPVNYA
jgi:hypothetical protein